MKRLSLEHNWGSGVAMPLFSFNCQLRQCLFELCFRNLMRGDVGKK